MTISPRELRRLRPGQLVEFVVSTTCPAQTENALENGRSYRLIFKKVEARLGVEPLVGSLARQDGSMETNVATLMIGELVTHDLPPYIELPENLRYADGAVISVHHELIERMVVIHG